MCTTTSAARNSKFCGRSSENAAYLVVVRIVNRTGELGLPPALNVCAGALDQACGAIGAGNIAPGHFSENTGAAVALCATVGGMTYDPAGAMPCHYHGLADRYMLHTFTGGGIVLRWFRDKFCSPEM